MRYDISYHVYVSVDYRLSLDPTWAETGDRYMLKLFRDYLFHQVSEDGRPWLDMSHVVQCLNKLDTGAPEKVSVHEICGSDSGVDGYSMSSSTLMLCLLLNSSDILQ